MHLQYSIPGWKTFKFKEAPSQICSFCKSEKENILHLFYKCSHVKNLWCELNDKLTLHLPPLSPKSAFFSFPDNSNLINHIHLIFRIAVYNSRSSSTCQVQHIINKINNVKKVELNIGHTNPAKRAKIVKKWSDLDPMVNILAKSTPPGRGGFDSGVPQKNKGQISTLLSALLARSANVLHLPKKYTFLPFRLIKLSF